eukprot:gene35048-1169_t
MAAAVADAVPAAVGGAPPASPHAAWAHDGDAASPGALAAARADGTFGAADPCATMDPFATMDIGLPSATMDSAVPMEHDMTGSRGGGGGARAADAEVQRAAHAE